MKLKQKKYIVQLIYTETTEYAGGIVEFNENSGVHTIQSAEQEPIKKIWQKLSYMMSMEADKTVGSMQGSYAKGEE